MENPNVKSNTSGNKRTSPSSSANSRWLPTSPQITMLERLYNQGLRTPTPDQIQQIAAMLGAYGHIEGKNVFYWFQNHKARQRQKLKQDTVIITNNNSNHHHHHLPFLNHHQHHHFLRNSQLPPPPHHRQHPAAAPPTTVIYGSYFPPDADQARLTRQQHPDNAMVVPAEGGFKGMQKAQSNSSDRAAAAYHETVPVSVNDAAAGLHDDDYRETLLLFPLHPTGSLLGRSMSSSSSPPPYDKPDNNYSSSTETNTPISGVEDNTTAGVGCCFDFFSLGQAHFCPPPHRF